jgi:hypothetical protein
MRGLGCLWNRSRLAPLADGALSPRAAAGASRHLAHCGPCRHAVEGVVALRRELRESVPTAPEPDWTGFWPGVQTRLRIEAARPIRESWWRPLWKPVWGHPRMAMATSGALAVLLAVSFWPAGESEIQLAGVEPVVVQDVDTPDPNGSVMVYSAPDRGPDRGVTVIWVFASAAR